MRWLVDDLKGGQDGSCRVDDPGSHARRLGLPRRDNERDELGEAEIRVGELAGIRRHVEGARNRLASWMCVPVADPLGLMPDPGTVSKGLGMNPVPAESMGLAYRTRSWISGHQDRRNAACGAIVAEENATGFETFPGGGHDLLANDVERLRCDGDALLTAAGRVCVVPGQGVVQVGQSGRGGWMLDHTTAPARLTS